MLEPPAEFTASQRQSASEQSLNGASPKLRQTGPIGERCNCESVGDDAVVNEDEHDKQMDRPEEDEEVTLIDEEDPELFQPSSPLEFDRNLPDIMEEDEEVDGEKVFEEDKKPKLKDIQDNDEKPSELATIQPESPIADTSGTSDASSSMFSASLSVQQFDQFLQDLRMSQLLEITEEQSRRISRPSEYLEQLPQIVESPPLPEETFSPRLSLLLPDEEHGGSSTVLMSPELVNALRMITTASVDEGPPEFPSSPPPGKLLSPRQSFRTPGAGVSLKRSLSHKERDFLKLLGSRLERMEEEQEERGQSPEHAHNQPNKASAASLDPHTGVHDSDPIKIKHATCIQ